MGAAARRQERAARRQERAARRREQAARRRERAARRPEQAARRRRAAVRREAAAAVTAAGAAPRAGAVARLGPERVERPGVAQQALPGVVEPAAWAVAVERAVRARAGVAVVRQRGAAPDEAAEAVRRPVAVGPVGPASGAARPLAAGACRKARPAPRSPAARMAAATIRTRPTAPIAFPATRRSAWPTPPRLTVTSATRASSPLPA